MNKAPPPPLSPPFPLSSLLLLVDESAGHHTLIKLLQHTDCGAVDVNLLHQREDLLVVERDLHLIVQRDLQNGIMEV